MASTAHLLLVSEDQGNTPALAHARQVLSSGVGITWVCSTASSQKFTELEAASALKNQYMNQLNLLVITRDERQPFEVLTGALDEERLKHCLNLLLDPESITEIVIAAQGDRQSTLSQWLKKNLQDVSCAYLLPESSPSSAADGLTEATAPSTTQNRDTKNRVWVKVIRQGREFTFDMLRTSGTLLDGAEDAGIDLPFSCRGGVCSTCRAKLEHGEVALVENYALEDWELEAGFTLPCQAEPISAEITLNYDEI